MPAEQLSGLPRVRDLIRGHGGACEKHGLPSRHEAGRAPGTPLEGLSVAVPAAPCFAGLMETALFAGLLSAPSQAAPPGGTVA